MKGNAFHFKLHTCSTFSYVSMQMSIKVIYQRISMYGFSLTVDWVNKTVGVWQFRIDLWNLLPDTPDFQRPDK